MITYYLEMTSAGALRPARAPAEPFAVRRAEVAFPALNRFFYTEVGRAYSWTTRLPWTEEQWQAWVERPEVQTWIGYVRETPAGYFELDAQREKGTKQVELAYFGLLPPFVGRGRWRGIADGGDPAGVGAWATAGLGAHVFAGPSGGAA